MSDLDELKKAIEAKGEAVNALRKKVDEYHSDIEKNGKSSAEVKESLEKINKGINDANDLKVDFEKRLGLIEVSMKRKGGAGDGSDPEQDEDSTEYRKEFDTYLRRGERKTTEMTAGQTKYLKAMEEKGIAVDFQPGQGYMVPRDTSGQMVKAIQESSNIRSIASVQSIGTSSLEGMRDNDIASGGWVGETASRPKTNVPDVGMWEVPTHELYANPRASQKLVEDSSVNIEQWITEKGAQIFSLLEETAFTIGDGVKQPRGFTTYTPNLSFNKGVIGDDDVRTIKSEINGDVTNPDRLVKMVYRLKGMYRQNATWAMSREGQEAVRLMRMDDKYVWQPGLVAGQPDRLLNHPVSEVNDMPEFATGSISIAFADFQRTYQIVDRILFSLLIDPFSAKPFIEYYMRRRVGGDVVLTDSMVYLQLTA